MIEINIKMPVKCIHLAGIFFGINHQPKLPANAGLIGSDLQGLLMLVLQGNPKSPKGVKSYDWASPNRNVAIRLIALKGRNHFIVNVLNAS
jgi:hypothetical protein